MRQKQGSEASCVDGAPTVDEMQLPIDHSDETDFALNSFARAVGAAVDDHTRCFTSHHRRNGECSH